MMVDQEVAFRTDEEMPAHSVASGTADRSFLLPLCTVIDVGQFVNIDTCCPVGRHEDKFSIWRILDVARSVTVVGCPPADAKLHVLGAIVAICIQNGGIGGLFTRNGRDHSSLLGIWGGGNVIGNAFKLKFLFFRHSLGIDRPR